ncbi:MAG: hypothetical protein RIR73_693 [Chloroflexota bacterium]
MENVHLIRGESGCIGKQRLQGKSIEYNPETNYA